MPLNRPPVRSLLGSSPEADQREHAKRSAPSAEGLTAAHHHPRSRRRRSAPLEHPHGRLRLRQPGHHDRSVATASGVSRSSETAMRNAEMAGSKARGLPVGTNDPDLSYTESFPAAQCSSLRRSRRVLLAVPRREGAPGWVPRGSFVVGLCRSGGLAAWPVQADCAAAC